MDRERGRGGGRACGKDTSIVLLKWICLSVMGCTKTSITSDKCFNVHAVSMYFYNATSKQCQQSTLVTDFKYKDLLAVKCIQVFRVRGTLEMISKMQCAIEAEVRGFYMTTATSCEFIFCSILKLQ